MEVMERRMEVGQGWVDVLKKMKVVAAEVARERKGWVMMEKDVGRRMMRLKYSFNKWMEWEKGRWLLGYLLHARVLRSVRLGDIE